jgi:DNA-binding CsgD family transcriptional regulator
VKPVNGSLRTVLVVEPQRLVRQALVAAIDAAPGLAEHGPYEPSVDTRGIIVVSRQTPLSAVITCLQAGPTCVDDLPVWHVDSTPTDRMLSVRERQVLGLLASGLSPAQAARALDITTYTVRDHIKSIRTKLDRPTTMSAVLEAIRLGLLRVEQA